MIDSKAIYAIFKSIIADKAKEHSHRDEQNRLLPGKEREHRDVIHSRSPYWIVWL